MQLEGQGDNIERISERVGAAEQASNLATAIVGLAPQLGLETVMSFEAVWLVAGGLMIVGVFITIAAFESRCPKCKRKFARHKVGPKRFSHQGTSQYADTSGRISSREQKVYKQEYICQYCAHRWEKDVG